MSMFFQLSGRKMARKSAVATGMLPRCAPTCVFTKVPASLVHALILPAV